MTSDSRDNVDVGVSFSEGCRGLNVFGAKNCRRASRILAHSRLLTSNRAMMSRTWLRSVHPLTVLGEATIYTEVNRVHSWRFLAVLTSSAKRVRRPVCPSFLIPASSSDISTSYISGGMDTATRSYG